MQSLCPSIPQERDGQKRRLFCLQPANGCQMRAICPPGRAEIRTGGGGLAVKLRPDTETTTRREPLCDPKGLLDRGRGARGGGGPDRGAPPGRGGGGGSRDVRGGGVPALLGRMEPTT